ncbi:phage tail protein [Streptococcus suis]|nr:phage tail protein [Streptococcus suis]
MSTTENRIEYGLENVHYAKITSEASDGTLTYETPKRLPGAVKIDLEPQGETINFQADNTDYYTGETNQGYSGTLTIAKMTEEFETEILGQKKGSDGTLSEFSDANASKFALLFQFEGDQNAIRHVLFKCSVSRPKAGSETKKADPNTTELSFTASPRIKDKKVKTKTTKDIKKEVYDKWFKKVYEPEDGVTLT